MTKAATLIMSLSLVAGAQTTRRNQTVKEAPPGIVKPDLPPAASAAVSLATEWQNGDPQPQAGDNGSVIYRYGAAMPPIVCAPERLTTILLEPGERVQAQPVIGDSSRWDYQLLSAGEGPTARTSVVLKPKRPNVSTDLVIATNRRQYQLQLVSQEKAHLSQVEFSYPPTANWLDYKAHQAEQEQKQKENTVASLEGSANFAYTAKSKQHPAFLPKTVYDDGHQTFLKMRPEAKDWDTAVLQTAGPNGCEIVNYRITGDTWVIDRLFMSAELVSGTGKKALRVSISRDDAPAVSCVKPGKVQTAKK
jgi:P-type conjugative transfer protein TrbG